MIKDDGAGIYTWDNTYGDNFIDNNIVLNGVGAGEGTSDTNRTRPWLSRERNGSRTQDVRTPARLRGLASAAPNLFRTRR